MVSGLGVCVCGGDSVLVPVQRPHGSHVARLSKCALPGFEGQKGRDIDFGHSLSFGDS